MRYQIPRALVVLCTAFLLANPARAQSTCPASALSTPKNSTLYLFMPTAVDNTFPSYLGAPTSPVNPFDMAQHDPNLNTAQVRQRAFELMQDAYCEFNMDVQLVTTPQLPMEPRWQIVGIGSDSAGPNLVGLAQDVDTGDADSQDFSRVWAESLEMFCGAELTGANSTLERWATAIANLAAHESSHSYGAEHQECLPVPGEDPAPNHFIADPQFGATGDTIADRLNHHSDTVYERFGHDVGLTFYTLHNWDFVNPNGSSADSLTIKVLSQAANLTIGWFYTGIDDPWKKPSITKEQNQVSYQGNMYNVFDLEFSTPKPWNAGPDGVVPAGEKFHVGASFLEQNPVIVWETSVSSGANVLSLRPRMFGYDAGTAGDGAFQIKFYNPGSAGSEELLLSDMQVFFLPRMVDLEQMSVGGALRTVGGDSVTPFRRQPRDREDGITDYLAGPVRIGKEPFTFPIAKLTDRRHLDREIREVKDCKPGLGGRFGDPTVVYCPKAGNVLSLFPATYTYVMATVTDPKAHYWDKKEGRYVDGPLSTRFFFQLGGNVPDANRNGLDDLVDIRNGSSSDKNENGIPDEAEERR